MKKTSSQLRIGGLQQMSTIDYPGQLSAVIFFQGCPWRCRYCHNPHLVAARGRKMLTWQDIEQFLDGRQGLLDAVVFSGGEPTGQKALLPAIQSLIDRGFLIGLHTGGAYPKFLKHLLPFTDWVGVDIKAPFDQYDVITQVKDSGQKAKQSLDLILASRVSFECRTTVHWDLLTPSQLLKLAQELADSGVDNYHIQVCRTDTVLDETLEHNKIGRFDNEDLWGKMRELFKKFSVRNVN